MCEQKLYDQSTIVDGSERLLRRGASELTALALFVKYLER